MNSPRFDFGPREPAFNRWSIRDEKEETKKETSENTEIKPKGKVEKEKDKKGPEPTKDDKDKKKREDTSEKKTISLEEKQEKRTEIIERSQEYKKQFEEVPIPNDPSTIARLIVAEHIINLDEQLHNPEAEEGPRTKQELEEALDYMCELAEKFEDPSVESSPQVQEAYETLLELTEGILSESEHPAAVVDEVAQALAISTEAPLLEEQSQRPPSLPAITKTAAPTAIALAAFLRNNPASSTASQPEPFTTSPSLFKAATGTTALSSHNASPRNAEHIERSAFTSQKPSIAEIAPASPMRNAERYHISPQSNNMARPLAAIALTSVAAANIHKSPEISHRHEPSSNEAVIVTTPNIQRASFAQSERDHTPRTIARPENQAYQPRYIAPIEHPRSSPETSLVTPDRKLEHMPLLSLLTLAKDVRLGYGRYLKDEFEKGHIDKAGLVKVLKAKKKGLDISREYTTQASDYRKRQGSIEFLSKSTDGNMAADAMPETSIATQTDNRKSDKGFQVIKEEFPHPVFERYTHPDKSVFQTSPKGPVPVNLIVTIAIIITLGIAMLLLLLPAFT